MSVMINMIGKKYGRLTVKRRGPDHICPNGLHEIQYYCDCDCGTKDVLVLGSSLRYGYTKSCGCIHKSKMKELKSKTNQYTFCDDYVIGITSNTGEEFYFDLDDYDKIKDKCWYDSQDYVATHYPTRSDKIFMHRYVMNVTDDEIQIDHINHNTLDNRKKNLRIANAQQNAINKGMMSNNTSGYTGVYHDKDGNKWCARIGFDGKNTHLGTYDSIEEALSARRKAENELFKEWSYYNSTGKETNE